MSGNSSTDHHEAMHLSFLLPALAGRSELENIRHQDRKLRGRLFAAYAQPCLPLWFLS
jgi:hypothetical protein